MKHRESIVKENAINISQWVADLPLVGGSTDTSLPACSYRLTSCCLLTLADLSLQLVRAGKPSARDLWFFTGLEDNMDILRRSSSHYNFFSIFMIFRHWLTSFFFMNWFILRVKNGVCSCRWFLWVGEFLSDTGADWWGRFYCDHSTLAILMGNISLRFKYRTEKSIYQNYLKAFYNSPAISF